MLRSSANFPIIEHDYFDPAQEEEDEEEINRRPQYCSKEAWRHGSCHCSSQRVDRCSFFFIFLSLLFAFCSTLGHDAFLEIVKDNIINRALVDSISSEHYASFIDSDDPKAGKVTASYTFFNLTNAADVISLGAKPHFELVGPVNYNYKNEKFNVTFDSNGNTITYNQVQSYFPKSIDDELMQEAEVVTVDLVLLAALNENQPFDDLIPFLYNISTNPSAIFVRHTLRQLLFGYTHPYLPIPFPGLQTNDSSVDASYMKHQPTIVATGKGQSEIGNTMEFLSYDGSSTLTCCRGGVSGESGSQASGECAPAYPSFEGSRIRGSFGAQFHPFVDPDETLQLATYDFGMLRNWPMECGNIGRGLGPGSLFDGSDFTARIGGCESYDIDGVRLNRYRLPSFVLGNATVNPVESAAYGITGPSGLLNQTSCELLAPIFLSRPFFLYTSSHVTSVFDTLPDYPDESRHGSFIGIEPMTGKVLDFAFRMQVNALVKPMTVYPFGIPTTYFSEIVSGYYPICWGQQRAMVTGNQNEDFTGSLYTGLRILAATRWASITLLLLCFLIATYLKFILQPGYAKIEREEEVRFEASNLLLLESSQRVN
jgi:hypothetical protein